MHEVWRKMQVKGRTSFLVLAPPAEFGPVLAETNPGWEVELREKLVAAGDRRYETITAFVKSAEDVAGVAAAITAHASGDESLVWVCYPKKSSRKYSAAISRDAGWDALIDLGWEGVRQIAVDEDWSALRFRPREAIRNYSRKTQIGKSGT